MKAKFLIFIFITSLLIPFKKGIAQSSIPVTKLIQTFYNPIKKIGLHEQYSVLVSNPSLKEGSYKELSMEGVVLKEGKYKNDLKVGKWSYKTEKGILTGIENYNQSGEFDGELISYSYGLIPGTAWNSPVMCSYAIYKSGKKNGEAKDWYCGNTYPKYTLKDIEIYLDGKKNGLCTYYNENGKKETESTYSNNEENETKKYDTSGHIVYTLTKVKSEDGTNFSVTETYFYSNGNKRQETIKLMGNNSALNFLRNTAQSTWYEDGGLRAKWTYSQDGKSADCEVYYKSGKLWSKGSQVLNVTEYLNSGNYSEWYENGQKKDECVFNKMGKITGHEIEWYDNGNKKDEGDWISDEGNGNQWAANIPKSYKAKDWFYWSVSGIQTSADGTPLPVTTNTNIKLSESDQLINDGKYDEAIKLLIEKINDGSPSINDFNQIGWSLIMTKQYSEAISYLKEGMERDETNLFIQGNLAHALLFDGQIDQAKEIYIKYKSYKLTANISWVDMINSDFDEFKKAGLPSENFAMILNSLK